MPDGLPLTLKLDERHAAGDGGILFTDSIEHRGRPRVARFHLWRLDRYTEVEAYPGDLLHSGGAVFRLEQVVSREAPVHLTTRVAPNTPDGKASFGRPFRLGLGEQVRLPSGQAVELVAITRFGVTLFFTDKNGVENFTGCDFGFWREDDLLFNVSAADRDRAVVELTVVEETTVNRDIPARYDEPISLTSDQVARFPDGLTLRLRRAQQYCYGVIGWNLLAHQGDDVSYPYVSLGAADSPEREDDFTLLNRQHRLRVTQASVSPQVQVELLLHAVERTAFPLDAVVSLPLMESFEGPDGIALRYRGSGHAHGSTLGPDGEEIPMTDAWADFEVTQDGRSGGFTVDLMAFDGRSRHRAFGFEFTVLEVSDVEARLQVTRSSGGAPDDDETGLEDFEPELDDA